MKRLFSIIAVLGLASVAWAGQYDTLGAVDAINYQKRTIVVDDSFSLLARDLKVFDIAGRPTNIFAIKEGSLVRGIPGKREGRQRVLVEVRLLSKLPSSEDRLDGQRRED